ncbi:MAG: PAS domain S-box protein, partial [Desulfobacteraceae bacterium]|nr:PAS domain S-box protein [Desulfobacteraceae bacterium]
MIQTDIARLDEITKAIHGLLNGHFIQEIELLNTKEDEISQLCSYVNRLIKEQWQLYEEILRISKGDLSPKIKSRLPAANSLKSLQAALLHLTWQTKQITKGDFKQKTDFLGEFSQSFNSMIEKLDSNNQTLLDEIKARQKVENKLINAYDHLERLVQERTTELKVSNIKLKKQIRERNQIQAALKENEEKYRSIFENSPLGIVHFDRFGVITACNENVCEILGSSVEKLIGFDSLKSVKDQKMLTVISEVLSGNKSQYEGRYYSATGNISKPVRANFAPIWSTDKSVIGAIGIFEDITQHLEALEDKTRLEAQLQHAIKMEAVGTLSGGIAHDFNNVLGIILANAEVAMEDIPEWNSARKNLEDIKSACNRAKSVVKQLLSFTRRTKPEKKNVKILPIIDESIKLLRPSIPSFIDIKLNIPKDCVPINADSTQIQQVLINLCTNAAQSMEKDGGVLEIGLTQIELKKELRLTYQLLEPGNYILLSIRDTGPGIEPAIMERIFDPYFTTQEQGESTGMGLTVVQNIIKSHQGGISVESEQGKGTAFKVYFPVSHGDVLIEERIDQEPLAGMGTILFIDDEEALVEMGGLILEKFGYEVETRTNPKEALALFKSDPQKYDVIVTDMTMPVMTG